jgi:hypothetical protein
MDSAVELMKDLKQRASAYGPEQFRGIATEAFRLSKNASDLIKRLYDETGVPITIVSHEEEAMYGFFNAMCHSNLSEHEIISWDSGAGSFQICTHDSRYLVSLGRVPVQHYIIETLQKQNFSKHHSPNPISYDIAICAVNYIRSKLTPLPFSLENKTVIAHGARSKLIPTGLEYTLDDVKALLFDNLNKTDQELGCEDSIFAITDLILDYSVMSHLGIEKALRVSTKASGNTSGILAKGPIWKNI